MRQVANQMLDSEAIRNRESSLEGERLEPLAEGDYVLKFVHGGLLTKVMPRWCGPYKVAVVLDDDNYLLQNLVQDYNEHDDARRHELVKVICRDDQHAIAEHQKDSFELTPTKVISHSGNADQVGSLFFTCEVEEFKEPQVFRFNDIKFTKVVQDYIKRSGKGPNGLAKLIHSIDVTGE